MGYLCKFRLFLLLGLLLSLPTLGQNYATGLALDDAAYAAAPAKAQLLSRDYTTMPSQSSLKAYCPTPMNQGSYSTCVGWSTAYAARSILEATQKGWTDAELIRREAFSPSFIYQKIGRDSDLNCYYGTSITRAFDVMKDEGVPKMEDYYYACPIGQTISGTVRQKANAFAIQEYNRLFSGDESYNFKLNAMKKAIAEGNPVVIGMICPPSFQGAKEVWRPSEAANLSYGGHAMCVIGYDDNKYGGAFEVMNSWGNNWGNEGFIWIDYQTFFKFTKYAYEPVAFPPADRPFDLVGEISLRQDSEAEMPLKLSRKSNGIAYYKAEESYRSGTRFRIYISNEEPAFVYAIGSDLSQKIFRLFPHKPGISAALHYRSNHVALPGEDYFIQMDQNVGTDYLCVLYCKKELDLEQLNRQLAARSASLETRIRQVLGSKLVESDNLNCQNNQANFKAKSEGKEIIAVMVEISHKP